jgi:1,6-anhydro-N-acetylmuramate kinase
LQQFSWRPRPNRTWQEKQKREFKKLYKSSLRKEIIEADEKAKNETLEFYKLQKELTKEKFFETIKPLQQKYAETKDKRRAIGAESDSEDEEEYVRYAVIDYY